MRLDLWLLETSERLRLSGVSAAKLEAQVIVAHVLSVDRSFVLTHPEHELDANSLEPFITRRELGEPLAYILGYREFFGRRFVVTQAVLIPRQDTECLIEAVLALKDTPRTVLDVGTGSGCIAITLRLERSSWDVTAVDLSSDALQIATNNAERLGASARFLESDMFSALGSERFNLIVSNPPYIDHAFPLTLEVKDFEPSMALFGGEDGLDFYRRFATESIHHLTDDGMLILEIGFDQGQSVPLIFHKEGWTTEVIKDLSGNDRVVVAHPVR